MSATSKTSSPTSQASKQRRSDVRVAVVTIVVLAAALGIVVWFALFSHNATPATVTPTTTGAHVVYPFGTVDLSEPSGMAPPSPHALAGYHLSYSTDFPGTTLPTGWELFSGKPGGDPGGQFAISHVTLSGGLLHINTWRDPKYNNHWVTGGMSQAAVSKTFGAYFIRSRVTGLGPSEVQLLWPADNSWPPEIDFNEAGRSMGITTATIHWSTQDFIEQHSVRTDMTKWHTWGVIWSPSTVRYTLDGHQWGEVSGASKISHIPMNLDFEQRSMCSLGFDCPTRPESMLVDWVVEYTAN